MTRWDPPADVPVPPQISALAGDDMVRPVWCNELGGLTFELTGTDRRRFAKWAPAGSALDLAAEAERLRWAVAFTPVPQVLDAGSTEAGCWLLTAGLPGNSAVAARWRADPHTASTAIGQGLRALHERLPVESCPFSWDVQERLTRVRAAGRHDPARWNSDHAELSPPEALARLADPPAVDQLVVCHGDACSPNTLLTDDGAWSGHVDLGALGVADRWADLAVATWSLDWNYGPGWQPTLLRAYGVEPDPDRTAYYRLLWDLSP
ncbi:aminoglycoside 3'-phosphotransferase [Phytohabitans rumicis]|uniref:Putative phosphotransferase n=1 Tax=Phytohabitans rumicis TaxID=1076125 RepID=A0A6V8KTL4_9ACTN|nr:aminoglycoside 3'-phosphotransferase [Phytohabitans rumicis]GFJ86770.1 putative phosphotransferase [Phytohabitans rumicis]